MLEKINSPSDLKKLHIDELEKLADEIRSEIIKTTLHNGGHLASNLGSVELTLALHYVFDAPEDKIIFDVGHQCYTHKLITGRFKRFDLLRKKDGISGFPNHNESEYDVFDAGHSSTSISTALGLARARDIKHEDYNIVALIGDGAIGGGMAFEALNDLGSCVDTKLIVVLNDNEMSISKNVGALSTHFSKLRAKHGYISSKRRVKKALDKISHSGRLSGFIKHIRDSIRYLLMGNTIFDEMGIKYLGPVNGHSLKELIEIFRKARDIPTPVVIHAVTCKGCGYGKAEMNPELYHGVPSCSRYSNISFVGYSTQLGNTLVRLAENDNSICAITASMTYNTGLNEFSKKYPKRFFDTGIAEQHALGMAAGLAKGGMRPFVVIYSTFLQRGFDQVFHDICLQSLPVTICIDHGGLTGEDGATHQGIYDLGFLRSMPNLTILVPRDSNEFDKMLVYASKQSTPIAIRYPKGSIEPSYENEFDGLSWAKITNGECGSLVTFGTFCDILRDVAVSCNISLIDARCIKPLDEKMLLEISAKPVFVFEDNASEGGLCEAILKLYSDRGIKTHVVSFALKDEFINIGNVCEQLKDNCMDNASITERIMNEIRQSNI